MGALNRWVLAAVIAVLVAGGLMAPASAAEGDIGHQGPSYSGATYVPTSDKPQSKLWHAHGSWWANMFDTVSQDWHIFRLDRSSQTWVDTGVAVDTRAGTLADALWNGSHLYVASHVVTLSGASQANSPARLYRYSYSPATDSFTLDAGFPTTITTNSSESLTIDQDSTGTVWATWTQVDGSGVGAVHANNTVDAAGTWGTPFVLPVSGVNPAADDISTIVAFGGNKVGILWSNQRDGTVYWAVRNDGAARDQWRGSSAIRGTNEADDHLNVKAIQADRAGRVFAVVKTGLESSGSSAPQIRVLVFKPGTGSWSTTTFGTVGDCHTRPQLVLDETNNAVHVVATAPSAPGCSHSGAAGTIYGKSASMDNPVFPTGRGTPLIRDADSPGMNDVTATKQSVDGQTGLVLLASEKNTRRYWHADIALTRTAAPAAAFSVTPATGEAPLAVQFTDTSSGNPTAWAWNFGDGATSTEQNPAHTYTGAGTYTVTLTASGSGGTGAAATRTVTVTDPVAQGSVTAGASTTALSTVAAAGVTIARPAGVASGDVLVAQITSNNAPAMQAVPAGWSPVVQPVSIGTVARVFAYYRVVTDAAVEPQSWTWRLSSAQTWNAGMTAFRGVDPVAVFDGSASTFADRTRNTTLTVPGVTTTTPGSMVIGGVGADTGTMTVTPPSGWTEAWEGSGAQFSEFAHRSQPTAGPTGDATWTFSRSLSRAGWVRALRPGPVGGA